MGTPGETLKQTAAKQVENRWPALLASLATAMLYYALPESLTVGPGWIVFALVVLLLIPATLSHRAGRVDLNDIFAYSTLGVIALALLSSLVLLILRLPGHKDPPVQLLSAAVALWL